MPIYEYKCEKCQAEFEQLVKSSAEKAHCEKCGSKKVEKMLSGFSARVKSTQSKSCSVSDCASCCPSGSCAHNH